MIYSHQDYSVFYINFIIFSLASLLLIDKIIFFIFRSSDNLMGVFGSHNTYNYDFSFNMILLLFIISYLFKSIQYILILNILRIIIDFQIVNNFNII